MHKKGFTLIELLVVVAIIGILAAIVLASLNSARVKAIDVSIKAAMSNIRPQAAIYYEDHSLSYTSMCAFGTIGGAYPFIENAVQRLNPTSVPGFKPTDAFLYSASGAYVVDTTYASICHASPTAWAAITSLKSPVTANAGWCVDSTGAAKEATALGSSIYNCP